MPRNTGTYSGEGLDLGVDRRHVPELQQRDDPEAPPQQGQLGVAVRLGQAHDLVGDSQALFEMLGSADGIAVAG